MKKLMFAAGAAVMVAGVAQAADPVVYDYKASVKHVYLKEVNAKNAAGATVKVYQKYLKSATLKGYLIHDVYGATSYSVHNEGIESTANFWDSRRDFTDGAATQLLGVKGTTIVRVAGARMPGDGLKPGRQVLAAGNQNDGATAMTAADQSTDCVRTAFDQGRNRAFLVVINNSATPKAVRAPKILPAVLEAKWFDTKYKHTATTQTLTGGVAEGYLFVGGDLGANARPRIDDVYHGEQMARNLAAGPFTTSDALMERARLLNPPAFTAGALASQLDFGWTSMYLFGEYNGPNWANLGGTIAGADDAWNTANNAIDAVQNIQPVTIGGSQLMFHDTWMNGSGFGKFSVASSTTKCCGYGSTTRNMVVLESLSGNLKGGLFICSENGYSSNPYFSLGGFTWDDQFFSPEANTAGQRAMTYAATFPGGVYGGAAVDAGFSWITFDDARVANRWWDVVGAAPVDMYTAYQAQAGDYDQKDIWIDGDVELNTTDVLYGTWQIKRTTKLQKAALVRDDYLNMNVQGIQGLATAPATFEAPYPCIRDLTATIKGAVNKLGGSASNYAFVTGEEYRDLDPDVSLNIYPTLTPSFVECYNLGNFR